MLKKILIPFLMCATCGCASFRTVPPVKKTDFKTAMQCSSAKPYAAITVKWTELSPISDADRLNDVSAENRTPTPVRPEYAKKFCGLAEKTMEEYKLYDKNNGSGTMQIELLSNNRWTYGQLIRGFFTDTPYVLLWPASVYVSHTLKISDGGKLAIEQNALVKTHFHLVLIPLYPFFTYSRQETATLKDLLHAAAYQIHKESCAK